MSPRFVSDLVVSSVSWQAFERLVFRLLVHQGFRHVMLVGASGDEGADLLASKGGRRWLFQVKRWGSNIGSDVVARTVEAAAAYGADVPVVVSRNGFTPDASRQQQSLMASGIPVQLWDRQHLVRAAERLAPLALCDVDPEFPPMKRYQTTATNDVMSNWLANPSGSSLVVLATGLGKTRVAAEAVRRVLANRPDARVVVLAHRNELVYQLERAFWPFLTPDQPTAVWNGYERPDAEIASQASLLFCCVDSVLGAVRAGGELPVADVVVVDECHHLGSDMYETVLDALSVGIAGGPYLVGLTATPWRPNGEGLDHRFQTPAISIDLVEGLKQGFLSNVDYRMFTDNVDWDRLRGLTGRAFSPASINRSLFIDEWDDAVVDRLREAWSELATPKAIVFCGTIHHAERVAARINALGFARARCVLSQTSAGQAMSIRQRSQVLWDFAEGRVQVVCAVDVLNEGVDVPDVNIVVFQRVTHSRRIFVQQLGRGLRVAAHKSKVIVLDFVSDVRRFAAGLELEAGLGAAGRGPAEVQLGSKVSFRRANSEDTDGLTFLREWLHDVAAIQDAGDEASVLAYPPIELLPGARR